MFIVTTFDPIAQPSGSFQTTFPNGKGTLRVKNASIVDLNFAINGFASMTTLVQADATVDIKMCPPYTNVTWSTAQKLQTNVKTIQSLVTVEGYLPGDNIPAVGAGLPRHINPNNIGFGVSFVPGSSGINVNQALAVFNPPTSGVNATFYSATYTNTVAFSFPSIGYQASNPAYPTALTPVNRLLGGPGSLMVCSGLHGSTLPTVTFFFDSVIAGTNTYEFIAYPDQILLTPGNSITMFMINTGTTAVIQMLFKWTETPV